MKKIKLVLIICCFGLTAKTQNIIFQENFSVNNIPPGWTQTDSVGQTPTKLWQFINGFNITGANFDQYIAGFYYTNSEPYANTYLNTPVFSTIGYANVFLTFSEQYEGVRFDDFQGIDISTNSGVTWQEVHRNDYFRGYPFAVRTVIDITQWAANYQNVKLRFHNPSYGAGPNWWAIDNLLIVDSAACTTPPDSGIAITNTGTYACPNQPIPLSIANLSRGIGQTYQWQLKNASTSNVYTNISGAVYDTLTTTQNQNTYYRCEVTCGGLSANSVPLNLNDIPDKYFVTDKQIEICLGRPDTLTLEEPAVHPPFTYQWQSGITQLGPFVNIPTNATNSIYVVDYANFDSVTTFRCLVGCAGNSTYRISYFNDEITNYHPYCYCLPYHNNPCTAGNYINYIGIAGTALNHTVDSCWEQPAQSYGSNSAYFSPTILGATAILARGGVYTITIGFADAVGTGGARMHFWIDYNTDGYFSINEQYNLGNIISNDSISYTFQVPLTASQGLTGLRIRAMQFYNPIDSNNFACEILLGGVAQDFMITLDSALAINNNESEILNIAVHPNPSKGETTVTSPLPIKSLKLVTVTGGVVLTPTLSKGEGVSVVLNVKELPQGIYFVEVEREKGVAVKKLVVMK